MHTQSLTATIDTAVARSTTTSRTALRTGSTLLLGGLVTECIVTSFHAAPKTLTITTPSTPKYSVPDNWITMHLGQFAAGLVGMTLPSHPTEPDPNSTPGVLGPPPQTSTRPDDPAGRVPTLLVLNLILDDWLRHASGRTSWVSTFPQDPGGSNPSTRYH